MNQCELIIAESFAFNKAVAKTETVPNLLTVRELL